jgi:hypothetical protein
MNHHKKLPVWSSPGLQEQRAAVKAKEDAIHEDKCAMELLPVSKDE